MRLCCCPNDLHIILLWTCRTACHMRNQERSIVAEVVIRINVVGSEMDQHHRLQSSDEWPRRPHEAHAKQTTPPEIANGGVLLFPWTLIEHQRVCLGPFCQHSPEFERSVLAVNGEILVVNTYEKPRYGSSNSIWRP